MAPVSRKRKSEVLEEMPQPTTPTGSPARKKLKITESQKQALIDNLQLEITERARHLRAHYALQCADLRSRVERRVNRIPIAMRKMKMGELMAKHEEATKAKPTAHAQVTLPTATDRPLPPLPQEALKAASPLRTQFEAQAPRGKKRKTSEIQIASDKENDDQPVLELLPVAKMTRGKAAAPTRAASRTQKPSSVLSPRSHNSRTLSRSPIKEWNSPTKASSPMKSMIARPVSPLKPASPLKSAASAATSALSAAAHGMARGAAATAGKLGRTASREKTATVANTKGKMLPPPRPGTSTAPSSPHRIPSSQTTTSEMSTTSTSTTVVTKPKRGRGAKAPATKTSPVAKKTVAATKVKTALKGNTAGANKKVVLAEPAAGRRVLRKRN